MIDLDECRDRRLAELEFIEAAYDPENEAWHDANASGDPVVHRKLSVDIPSTGSENDSTITICLSLTLPLTYPVGNESLHVTARLWDEGSTSDTRWRKCALNAIPHLVALAQSTADETVGSEAVFAVLSRAEEWVSQGEWGKFFEAASGDQVSRPNQMQLGPEHQTVTFGRRLIYSHHIISKIKRADIKALAADLQLTGYMKVGWPGILVVEGQEDDCILFYDKIRRWNWQYLVVRGEQQDRLAVSSSSHEAIQAHRKFATFQEIDDMAILAKNCREVGLEALFRTSMKVYDNTPTSNDELSWNNTPSTLYGVLVHVDHMNDPKGYRKWLRKTARETGCHLIIKQCYPHEDYSKRPKIVVGIVAESSSDTSDFLKRWRTSRVDVDSRGKPCLERQMTILTEGVLPASSDSVDWEKTMTEDSVTTSSLLLGDLLLQIGGCPWKEALETLILTGNMVVLTDISKG